MNQREFTRVRTAIPLDCTFPDGRVLPGATRDVSMNGCFIPSAEPPPEDAECVATLYVDGREGQVRIQANAQVIRTKTGGFALHFRELLELDSYEHLRNLILYNADDPNQAENEFDNHLGLKRPDPARSSDG
jgi:hypothetical protein